LSFSSRAKQELANERIKGDCCCRMAALSALMRMSGSLQLLGGGKRRLRIKTESYAVARWTIRLAKSLFPLQSEILIRERKRLGKTRSFAILLFGDALEQALLETGFLKETEDGMSLGSGIPDDVLENDCCRRAYMRGAFLGGGSISNPEKGYHLEIVVASEQFGKELCDLLNCYALKAKMISRKTSYVVYLKESEKITDFLALIGANGALLDLENVRTEKDFTNNLNRKFNCETANIRKSVEAAVRQNEAIRYLLDQGVFSKLSPELRAVAELRIEHPELSLAELGKLMEPPLGKSGVNHRLRKLEGIALSIKHQKGDA
jgi:DNA-binding protein WhiA